MRVCVYLDTFTIGLVQHLVCTTLLWINLEDVFLFV